MIPFLTKILEQLPSQDGVLALLGIRQIDETRPGDLEMVWHGTMLAMVWLLDVEKRCCQCFLRL
jgi:hypothetical protein